MQNDFVYSKPVKWHGCKASPDTGLATALKLQYWLDYLALHPESWGAS